MNDLIYVLVGLGGLLLVIALTKMLWQWVLGTDVLIEESKQQTDLLHAILKTLKAQNEESNKNKSAGQ